MGLAGGEGGGDGAAMEMKIVAAAVVVEALGAKMHGVMYRLAH
jgi:hypothetical protein